MGAFPLPFAPPALAVVAAHGLTDLDSCDFVPTYLTACTLPLPAASVTVAFCIASFVHFSEDVGYLGSAALHAALFCTERAFGQAAALRTAMSYLSFVHLPLHYRRCWKRERYNAIAIAGVGTAAAVALSPFVSQPVVLTHAIQRIACAHIFHELRVRVCVDI